MKRDWADGYVSDVTYSHGYYHELAPPFIRFFLLMGGHACPPAGGGYTYCELGYGQGLSANIHAAANPLGEFWGTDFNPDHALFANALATEAGMKAHWLGASFEEMLDAGTPQFDFIVLHGIWSWVSAQAQHDLVEFIRRKLKVGGAVFVSYNILPGWTAEKPLRDLLYLHTEQAGAPGASSHARIHGALAFADKLRKKGAQYFADHPRAGQLLDEMLGDDTHQLAHEYFNQAWWLTSFSDLARAMAGAGVEFAGSLHMSDLCGEVRQKLAACDFLDAHAGPVLRETAADFMLDRRFRRDLFVRGSQRMPAGQRAALLDEVALLALRGPDAISPVVTTPYGRFTAPESIVRPLADAICAADGPHTIGRLLRADTLRSFPREQVLDVIALLVARRDASPVFPSDAASVKKACTRSLNQAIARHSRFDNALRYLASPRTGMGVECDRFERLFLLAWEQGSRRPEELAQAAAASCAALPGTQGSDDLLTRATRFAGVTAPHWRYLGILAGDTHPKKPSHDRG